MRSTYLLVIIFMVSTFAAACSSSSSGGSSSTDGSDGTDGATSTDGTDGVVGADDGDTTNTSDLITSEPQGPTCASDVECPDGGVCDCNRRCVAGGLAGLPKCIEDKNCGSENYCDQCAKVCRVQKTLCESCADLGVGVSGIATSNECAEGGTCTDFASGGRFCLRECISDAGCPPAFKCLATDGGTKQCQPKSGACSLAGECTKDTECEFGEVCNSGTCAAGCADDTGCPNGNVCSSFRCVPACSEQNPCPSDLICSNGKCKIEGGCVDATECPEPETYCDPVAKLCSSGCLLDFDCKASEKECKNWKCIDKGCTGNFFCAFEQVCNLSSGKCEEAVGPYCEAGCDPESEASCGGKPNRCLQLQDKDGNDIGAFCFVACLEAPTNRCPQGYGCQEVEIPDSQGNPEKTELCFRDCTNKPLGAE